MAEAFRLPYEFVDYLLKPGLDCGSFRVPLDAYLSGNHSNGGADSAVSLIGNIRSKVRDGGTGPTLQELYGSGLDAMWRGCGHPDVIRGVWKFLCRNKEALKSVKVGVYDRRDQGEPDEKNKVGGGTVYDLYFKGRSDKEAIAKMVDDRFFGLDCIGFMGNFMVWVGEWDTYKNNSPTRWADKVFKNPVNKAEDIKELDLLCWSGHVAIVDWIWRMVDDTAVLVDICQSSSGGPQCNSKVILRQTSVKSGGKRLFKIEHRGTPSMPVHSNCTIMRRDGFFY
ncbi:MAG: hypothetical protein KDG55_10625 [Rhodocyclaceae bacterium]|nr:hypothetical protein [Rhodocyclaceae bacterium]